MFENSNGKIGKNAYVFSEENRKILTDRVLYNIKKNEWMWHTNYSDFERNGSGQLVIFKSSIVNLGYEKCIKHNKFAKK